MKRLRFWPLASLLSLAVSLAVLFAWPSLFEDSASGPAHIGDSDGHGGLGQRSLYERAMAAGAMASAKGDYAIAQHQIESAIRKAERFGANDQRLGIALDALVRLYAAQARYAEAVPVMLRAIAIGEASFGPGSLKQAAMISRLAQLHLMRGEPAQAQAAYERALALVETFHAGDQRTLAGVLNELAIALHAQGKDAEAEPLVRRALAIREATLSPSHPDLAMSVNNLAVLLRARRDYAGAEMLYRRAIAALSDSEMIGGIAHPYLPNVLESYAVLLRETGRIADAEATEARAKAMKR